MATDKIILLKIWNKLLNNSFELIELPRAILPILSPKIIPRYSTDLSVCAGSKIPAAASEGNDINTIIIDKINTY